MQKDTGQGFWHHYGIPFCYVPLVLGAFVAVAYLVPEWLSSWQGFLISLSVATGLVYLPFTLLAKWLGWHAPLKQRNLLHFGGGANGVALVAAWLIFPSQGIVQPWWLYVIAYFVTRATVMLVFRVLVGPSSQTPSQTQQQSDDGPEAAVDADEAHMGRQALWGVASAPVILLAFVQQITLLPALFQSSFDFVFNLVLLMISVSFVLAQLRRWWSATRMPRQELIYAGAEQGMYAGLLAALGAAVVLPELGIVQPWWVYVILAVICVVMGVGVFRNVLDEERASQKHRIFQWTRKIGTLILSIGMILMVCAWVIHNPLVAEVGGLFLGIGVGFFLIS